MGTSVPKKKQGRMVGDYVLEERIGQGSFANVWKAHHKDDEKIVVAIKSINREKINLNKKHQENLEQEIKIMRRLEHPNIVRLYDIQVSSCGGPVAALCGEIASLSECAC